MITYSFLLGVSAGLFSIVAWSIYMLGILRKRTRPNRATWSILTLLGILVLFSYYDGGARDTIWVAVAYVVGPFLTAILSIFYYGEGGWTSFDKKCLSAVTVCFILWLYFRIFIPQIALPILIISLAIDFVGLLPTIKKSWKDPEFENPPAWLFESLASLLNLFAVTTWVWSIDSFSIWIYPVYLAIVNIIIAALLFTGKYRIKT